MCVCERTCVSVWRGSEWAWHVSRETGWGGVGESWNWMRSVGKSREERERCGVGDRRGRERKRNATGRQSARGNTSREKGRRHNDRTA